MDHGWDLPLTNIGITSVGTSQNVEQIHNFFIKFEVGVRGNYMEFCETRLFQLQFLTCQNVFDNEAFYV